MNKAREILDPISRAMKEFDFDLTPIPVSTRTSKGLIVSKWLIKDVKPNDLILK
jgi:topoisomerase-4 subunit A